MAGPVWVPCRDYREEVCVCSQARVTQRVRRVRKRLDYIQLRGSRRLPLNPFSTAVHSSVQSLSTRLERSTDHAAWLEARGVMRRHRGHHVQHPSSLGSQVM